MTSDPEVPFPAPISSGLVDIINVETGELRRIPRYGMFDYLGISPEWDTYDKGHHARLLEARGTNVSTATALPPAKQSPELRTALIPSVDDDYVDTHVVWHTSTVVETTLARLPIWAPGGSKLESHDGWSPVGSLYNQPVYIREPLGPLTMHDALLASCIQSRFLNAGCPLDNKVPLSLGEAALLCGHASKGGRQREQAKQSLERLYGTEVRCAIRVGSGGVHVCEWRILASPGTVDARGGMQVQLGAQLADQLRNAAGAGTYVFLDLQKLHDLLGMDELGARLWMLLESESYARPWKYQLYSSSPDKPERERHIPAIADLLRVSGRKRRSNVRERVARAAAVIERVDPRYRLSVAPQQRRGRVWASMWNLHIERLKAPTTPDDENSQDAPEA